MSEAIPIALISGSTTIVATLITVLGLYVIARHRKTVINLCRNIEAYHRLETELVSEILELENKPKGCK